MGVVRNQRGKRHAMPESSSTQESKALGMDPFQSLEEHMRFDIAEKQGWSCEFRKV
jgi:hypothetical protein